MIRTDESPNAVWLRPAVAADAGRLCAIAIAAKSHWGYPAGWLEGWRDELTVTPAAMTRDRYRVADIAGRIVGFAAVSAGAGNAELEHLWVEPGAMGRGVGRRLLEDALAGCAAAGARRLRVVSDPHAAAFYRRLGGVPVGDVPSTPAPRRLPLLEFAVPGRLR